GIVIGAAKAESVKAPAATSTAGSANRIRRPRPGRGGRGLGRELWLESGIYASSRERRASFWPAAGLWRIADALRRVNGPDDPICVQVPERPTPELPAPELPAPEP